MLRLVAVVGILALATAQHLGTNYRTDDGQSRSENIDQDGNVRGQYSFVDPNGKTVTINYSAGKDGFQVEDDQPRQLSGGSPPLPGQFQQRSQFSPQLGQFSPEQYILPGNQFSLPSARPSPAFARQFTPITEQSEAPSGPQFVDQQQGLPQFGPNTLFVPSGRSLGNAASQGQISQFNEGENPSTQAPPVQLSQQPTPQQFAPPSPPAPRRFPSPALRFSQQPPQQLFQDSPLQYQPQQLPQPTPALFSRQPSPLQYSQQLPGPPQRSLFSPQQYAPQPPQQHIPQLRQQISQGGPLSFPSGPQRFPSGPEQLNGLVQGSDGSYKLFIGQDQQ